MSTNDLDYLSHLPDGTYLTLLHEDRQDRSTLRQRAICAQKLSGKWSLLSDLTPKPILDLSSKAVELLNKGELTQDGLKKMGFSLLSARFP